MTEQPTHTPPRAKAIIENMRKRGVKLTYAEEPTSADCAWGDDVFNFYNNNLRCGMTVANAFTNAYEQARALNEERAFAHALKEA